jgi:hypothetical protein
VDKSAGPSSKRAPLPQTRPILPQQKWRRQPQSDGDEPQQAIPPPVAQKIIHGRREKREAEASQAPQNRSGADGGSGEAGIAIDEIRLNTLKADDDASAEDTSADIRHDPVCMVLSGPAVEEEAYRQDSGAGDHEGDAELRSAGSVVALLEGLVDVIVDGGADLGGEEEAEAEGDVVEAADADGFVVDALPEAGEGGEDEVEDAVEVRHVDGEDLHNGLRGQEAEGPHEGASEGVGEGAFRVLKFGLEVGVAGFIAEPFGFLMQEFGRVGFSEEEEAGDLDDGVGDRGGVECPAPGGSLRDEAACDGPNCWSEEGRQAVDTDGPTSLLGPPTIAEDATADLNGISPLIW